MFKISALNESSDSCSSSDEEGEQYRSKEAEEEEAFALYNRALASLKKGNFDEAEECFVDLLYTKFISEVVPDEDAEKGSVVIPALNLKYSTYKNLALIDLERKDYQKAIESYSEAVQIDATEATVWYRMATTALLAENYQLAKTALHQVLELNSNHWPALDLFITLLYAMNNYEICVEYLALALKKDSGYIKANAIRKKIFTEQPSLRTDTARLFKDVELDERCDDEIEPEEQEYIDEALEMRRKRRSCSSWATPPDPVIGLLQPMQSKSWLALGQSLLDLYDHITSGKSNFSLCCKVDFFKAQEMSSQEEVTLSVVTQSDFSVFESEQPENKSDNDQAMEVDVQPELPASEGHHGSPVRSAEMGPSELESVGEPQEQPASAKLDHDYAEKTDVAPSMDPDNKDGSDAAMAEDGCVTSDVVQESKSSGDDEESKMKVDANPPSEEDDKQKRVTRRSNKRKRTDSETVLLELVYSDKRRSARVAKTTNEARKSDFASYQDLLMKFLPASLKNQLSDLSPDCENSSSDSFNCDKPLDSVLKIDLVDDLPTEPGVKLLTTDEDVTISELMEKWKDNNGIIQLVYKFVIALSAKFDHKWPMGLDVIYLTLYKHARCNYPLPSFFDYDIEDGEFLAEILATLCNCEFKLNQWLGAKTLSPLLSATHRNRRNSTSSVVADFPNVDFESEMYFLLTARAKSRALAQFSEEYIIRVEWLKARYQLLQGNVEVAVESFSDISEVIGSYESERHIKLQYVLANCSQDNIISLDEVSRQLELIHKVKNLDEVHRFFERDDFENVIQLVAPTFKSDMTSLHRSPRSKRQPNATERQAQLGYLLCSLWKTDDFVGCLKWGGNCFEEALRHYLTETDVGVKESWNDTIAQILNTIERSLHKNSNLISGLSRSKLSSFALNLVQLITHHLEHMAAVKLQLAAEREAFVGLSDDDSRPDEPDTRQNYKFVSTVAWILLHRVVKQVEDSLLTRLTMSSPDPEYTALRPKESLPIEGVPSSLRLLFSAHELLGNYSLCTLNHGVIMLQTVKSCLEFLHVINSYQEVLEEEEQSLLKMRREVEKGLEQCFYCLYSYPNRKGKTKYLDEHKSNTLKLTWKKAQALYEFYKPYPLPDFDSLRNVSTISSEVEELFNRILDLAPEDLELGEKIDKLISYLEGQIDILPQPDEDLISQDDFIIFKDVYYVLADYYFKNGEPDKSVDFYMKDIVFNPDRLNSWAGMALAKSSQLLPKLSLCEFKNDTSIFRKCISGLRCFRCALQIDGGRNSTLWIEMGNLAYIIHAHASRQIAQKAQYSYCEDVLDMLKKNQRDMLISARDAFEAANRIEAEEATDEAWLHHYMLGKIAEKESKPPAEYLDHFKKAAQCLHDEGAKYPSKLHYNNPPGLAVESLEIYYRIHSSILKYLIKHEDDVIPDDILDCFRTHIFDCVEGPFVKQEERGAATDEQKKNLKAVSNDHDYQATANGDTPEKAENSLLNRFQQKHGGRRSSTETESENEGKATRNEISTAVRETLECLIVLVADRSETIQDEKLSGQMVVLGDISARRRSSRRGNTTEILATTPNSDTVVKEKPVIGRVIVMNERPILDTVDQLIDSCLDALRLCLQRFPFHYKSLFRLAHYYYASKKRKSLAWCRDYFLGPQASHMTSSALFGERKNINFFNGIWRIPSEEIERPGSFACHMFRSVCLLIDICFESKDHSNLTNLVTQLHKTPDLGKKYLRDLDRLFLHRLAFGKVTVLLRDQMEELCQPTQGSIPDIQPGLGGGISSTQSEWTKRQIKHLLDVYSVHQQLNKLSSDRSTNLLTTVSDCFQLYCKANNIPCQHVGFDQAVRFCQQQIAMARYTIQSANSAQNKTPVGFTVSSRNGKISNKQFTPATTPAADQPIDLSPPKKGIIHGEKPVASSPFPSSFIAPHKLTSDVQSIIKRLDQPSSPVPIACTTNFQMEYIKNLNPHTKPIHSLLTHPQLPLKTAGKSVDYTVLFNQFPGYASSKSAPSSSKKERVVPQSLSMSANRDKQQRKTVHSYLPSSVSKVPMSQCIIDDLEVTTSAPAATNTTSTPVSKVVSTPAATMLAAVSPQTKSITQSAILEMATDLSRPKSAGSREPAKGTSTDMVRSTSSKTGHEHLSSFKTKNKMAEESKIAKSQSAVSNVGKTGKSQKAQPSFAEQLAALKQLNLQAELTKFYQSVNLTPEQLFTLFQAQLAFNDPKQSISPLPLSNEKTADRSSLSTRMSNVDLSKGTAQKTTRDSQLTQGTASEKPPVMSARSSSADLSKGPVRDSQFHQSSHEKIASNSMTSSRTSGVDFSRGSLKSQSPQSSGNSKLKTTSGSLSSRPSNDAYKAYMELQQQYLQTLSAANINKWISPKTGSDSLLTHSSISGKLTSGSQLTGVDYKTSGSKKSDSGSQFTHSLVSSKPLTSASGSQSPAVDCKSSSLHKMESQLFPYAVSAKPTAQVRSSFTQKSQKTIYGIQLESLQKDYKIVTTSDSQLSKSAVSFNPKTNSPQLAQSSSAQKLPKTPSDSNNPKTTTETLIPCGRQSTAEYMKLFGDYISVTKVESPKISDSHGWRKMQPDEKLPDKLGAGQLVDVEVEPNKNKTEVKSELDCNVKSSKNVRDRKQILFYHKDGDLHTDKPKSEIDSPFTSKTPASPYLLSNFTPVFQSTGVSSSSVIRKPTSVIQAASSPQVPSYPTSVIQSGFAPSKQVTPSTSPRLSSPLSLFTSSPMSSPLQSAGTPPMQLPSPLGSGSTVTSISSLPAKDRLKHFRIQNSRTSPQKQTDVTSTVTSVLPQAGMPSLEGLAASMAVPNEVKTGFKRKSGEYTSELFVPAKRVANEGVKAVLPTAELTPNMFQSAAGLKSTVLTLPTYNLPFGNFTLPSIVAGTSGKFVSSSGDGGKAAFSYEVRPRVSTLPLVTSNGAGSLTVDLLNVQTSMAGSIVAKQEQEVLQGSEIYSRTEGSAAEGFKSERRNSIEIIDEIRKT